MTIQVTQNSSEGPVCVVVNDYCNHADTRFEDLDYGRPVYRNGELDYEDDWRLSEVCNHCGEAREVDGDWNE